MTPIVVTATRLADGTDVLLDRLTELTLTSTLRSPAGAMRCTAVVDKFPGELGGVSVREGGRTLFTGAVDRQVAMVSEKGRTLALDARTKGAVLLDNEAVPCVLTGALLSTVFGLFCEPYGFRLESPGVDRVLPLFTVHKGLSEWEALAAFVRRAYGVTAHVGGDRVHVGLPETAGAVIIGRGGHPYTRLEQAVTPYSILSKVVLRDVNGGYTSAVENSAAGYYGVRRKRYVIPANEFMDNPGLDANQRIRRSMLDKEYVTVTVPGILDIAPGREVRVVDETLPGLSGLKADEVTLRVDPSGVTTTVGLTRAMYYE